MKNYRIWLIIVLALFVINSVVLALMWFHRRPPLPHEYGRPQQQHLEAKDVLTNALAFTPRQAILFDTMRTRHRQLVNKLEDENHKLRDSLFSNIKKPKVDSLVINSITKKISDNQVQIEQATLYHFRELRSILTAEQQVKFDGIINQVLQMMGRPGPMQGPPKGDKRPGEPVFSPEPGADADTVHLKDHKKRHFGPPNRMPPPEDDRRRGHRPPPPDGMPPGPPPGGPPPDGPPPN